jgi:hypothetical protein
MSAHNFMLKENAPAISESAMQRRTWLAESSISDFLFPVDYTDPHNTMDKLCAHLESGGSAVCVSTHPSTEDVPRGSKFFSQWQAIRNRRIAGPVAVHQRKLGELITRPFAIESVPVVTNHSRERRSYDRETIARYLHEYADLMIDVLSHNGTMIVASQADQMPKLTPPAVPVIDFILRRTHNAGLTNILFVPVGIEIAGMRDYSRARNITLQRHTYIFNVGLSYMGHEIETLSKEQGVTTDYWFYTQHLPLVSPEYR